MAWAKFAPPPRRCTVRAEKLDEGKAVVFYQSALIVDPQNFMAANELGVLLTRFGRWNDARNALEHAVAASGTPTSWRNLAVVCDRMGDQTESGGGSTPGRSCCGAAAKVRSRNADSKYAIEMVDSDNVCAIALRHGWPGYGRNIDRRESRRPPPQQPVISTAPKPNDKPGFWPWSRK